MYLPGHIITSGYGNRPGGFHHGVDFDCAIGTPIPALVSGEVVFAGYIPAAIPGYPAELICIIQSEGYFILYGHLIAVLRDEGERLESGEDLARSGNSGYTTGAHLHIEKRLGTKSAAKTLHDYQSQDIRPMLDAYGQEGDTDVTTFNFFKFMYLASGQPMTMAEKLARDRVADKSDPLKTLTNDFQYWVKEAKKARENQNINAIASFYMARGHDEAWAIKTATAHHKAGVKAVDLIRDDLNKLLRRG